MTWGILIVSSIEYVECAQAEFVRENQHYRMSKTRKLELNMLQILRLNVGYTRNCEIITLGLTVSSCENFGRQNRTG